MVKIKKKTNALGRGLKALITQNDNKRKESEEGSPDDEALSKNMEFYRSLVKQYVRTGERDMLIEQLLNDIRSHLEISDEDHLHLLKTLRKREMNHPKPSDESRKKVKREIKEELKTLFSEIKGEEPKIRKKKVSKKNMIPLPDRTPDIVEDPEGMEKPIEAPPFPDDDKDDSQTSDDKVHDGSRIIQKKRSKSRLKLEWDEDDANKEETPIEPEINDLEGSDKPIPLTATKKGLDERSEPIEAEPSSIEKEEEEVPMGVMLEGAPPSKEDIQEAPLPVEMEKIDSDTRAAPETPDEEKNKIKLEDSLLSLRILLEEGEIDEAYDMSNRLLEKDPENSEILNECGVILYNKDDLEASLECFRKAFDIEEPTEEMLINYSLVLSEKGELDKSLRTISGVIEKDPYSEDAWNNKAVILFKAGRLREALKALDNSLRINDKSVETWLNTGVILESMGELGPAMECYRTILELDPGNSTAESGVEYCRKRLT